MLTSLLLPVLLSAVALFIASFLSWVILPLHYKDWMKAEGEDELMQTIRDLKIPPGNYMIPGWNKLEEAKTEDYQEKYKAGPNGVLTLFGKVSMGQNLGLTFVYFLVISFFLAYVGTIAFDRGAEFKEVFRLISTVAFMTFLAAIVQHAIWFKNRIVGHVIESIAYAAITGAIFAAMWPGV